MSDEMFTVVYGGDQYTVSPAVVEQIKAVIDNGRSQVIAISEYNRIVVSPSIPLVIRGLHEDGEPGTDAEMPAIVFG